ncbi:GH25 family lysozyme, partial [Extibacter muris]
GTTQYYMGSDGSVQKGVLKAGGKVYYADVNTGIIQKKAGWIDYKGRKYYSNAEGILYSNQFLYFGTTQYYMGSDGSVQKGVLSTGGKLYYADINTGIIRKSAGWIDYNGKKYYSNAEGVLYNNQFISFGIDQYYMGADGSVQKGYQYIDGRLYHFDEVTGVLQRNMGWFQIASNKYYQKADGTLATGFTDIEGVRHYFNQNGVLSSKMGIDVSEFQGNINWNSVKQAGVEFAFIRVGYRGYGSGKLMVDSKFKQNITGALMAGIPVGVYFWSQAITVAEAQEEARFVYDQIKGYKIEFPVVLDSEFINSNRDGRADKLDASTRTLLINIFCSEIRKYNYTPMVYSSTSFLNTHINMSLLTNYQTWVAQYNKTLTYRRSYKCWQYTSSGKVNGINGNVDMNVWIN